MEAHFSKVLGGFSVNAKGDKLLAGTKRMTLGKFFTIANSFVERKEFFLEDIQSFSLFREDE